MGLTVEDQLEVTGRQVGLAQAMQLDVAQQQGHKRSPADHSGLRFSIRWRVCELGQQICGDSAGIGVASLRERLLGILVALLEFWVHNLRLP